MPGRPYTVLSCATSMDGYLDDASEERLVLSNDADLDRVDALRASCDAILVGSGTVRRDNPRLLVRDPARVALRTGSGQSPTPLKVTVTACGDLDPEARFFATGDCDKLVYCASAAFVATRRRLGSAATVVDAGTEVDMGRVGQDLDDRGVARLLVEGGGTVLTQFLVDDLADELQLVVAPIFVGDSRARRFVGDGTFPWHPRRRAKLAEVRTVGDVALLRYALSARFAGAELVAS
ncbi:RibD family protein [Cellulomonas alba]|uniref:Dihydrofolate reductase family protein n=1 Tax=Cellulomonas alba TaxID=3053467 RepID=A0ABT7SJA2_9CELL|nr:dihydrofolate reductase family protein [Cellulomonas alba]MDM7856269.1 dihydrofolate reductase family protein [Cellulomonas alba]